MCYEQRDKVKHNIGEKQQAGKDPASDHLAQSGKNQ
jgi:hypothetical protein